MSPHLPLQTSTHPVCSPPLSRHPTAGLGSTCAPQTPVLDDTCHARRSLSPLLGYTLLKHRYMPRCVTFYTRIAKSTL